jgi:hypothetical protein
MTLRFDDGMEFDVSGELRVVRRPDGWYVVGQGILAAVDGIEDGERLIEKLRHGGGTEDALRTR